MTYEPWETYEHAGLTVEFHQDFDAENPRTAWDNGSTMVAFSRLAREYHIADRQADSTEEDAHDRRVGLLERYLRLTEGAEVAFFYFADYGSGGARLFKTDDEGASGFFYMTRDEIVHEYGDDGPEARAKARGLLAAEIEVEGQYVEGDVHGFVIKDEEGNVLDSLWGIYDAHPYEYLRSEANGQAEWEAEERSRKAAEEAQERTFWANHDLATEATR